MTRSSFRLLILALALLALVGMPLAAGLLARQNTSQVTESADWVSHTHEVLTELQAALRSLFDAESSQRTYLLTHDKADSERLATAGRAAMAHLDRVRALTTGDPAEQIRLADLRQKMEQRLSRLREVAGVASTGTTTQAAGFVAQGAGREMTQAISAAVRAMEDEEQTLLAARVRRFEENTRTTAWLFNGLAALIAILVALMLFLGWWYTQQRRRAEQALRASELRYRSIIASLHEGILLYAADGRVLAANTSAQHIMEMSADEIAAADRARLVGQAIHEDGRPFLPEEIPSARARATGEAQFGVIIGLKRSGDRVIWLSANAQPLFLGEQDRPEGVVVSFSDITERKQAESALRASEARFRALLESAPDSIVIVDGKGHIVLVNGQTEKVFGYGREELLGREIEVLVPERYRPVHVGQRNGYIGSPRTRPMGDGLNIIGRRKDGSEVPLEISLSPIPTDQGMLVASVIRDISERRRVEAALARHAAAMDLLRTVAIASNEATTLEQAMQICLDSVCAFMKWPIGHLYLAAEGNNELAPTTIWHIDDPSRFSEFRRISESLRLNSGVGLPGRVLGRAVPVWVDDLSAEPDLPRAQIAMKEGVRAGFAFPVVIGAEVVGVLEFFSTEATQQEPQLLEVMQQIGVQLGRVVERRRADRELLASNTKLRQSNRALEDFASVASHDLQEPLRKVQAFGDRLKTRYAAELKDDGRDYLERMQGAAGRMQTLITDLLTFSRVTSKAQPFSPVDLGKIAREVISDLEVRIEQSGATVEVGEMPTIDADPLQIRQLLQNLLGNALKFIRPGVAPRVRVYGQIAQQSNGDGNEGTAHEPLATIYVEDNGIGFEEKYLDRIFLVFQRLHGRTEYSGTGIGLAVCRKIAERHRGSITARSQVGQGSAFIVTLPVHQTQGEYAL